MSIFDPETIIQSGGLLLIGAIVFAESGLLIGFFLPGDTLLFSAGFFAAQGKLPILGLLAVIVVAAILGDNVGYSIGKRTGKKIFKKEDGILFRKEYIQKAEEFYEKHGGKTITLARFVPIVRTFAPVVAGAAKMDRKRVMMFNIAGGLTWGLSVTLLGYFLGNKIPNIDAYLLPVVLSAVILTTASPVLHILRDKKARTKISSAIKQKLAKKDKTNL
ncbi:MAG: VTT domain-containing protein [Candidatus Saccharibacteria bacterium]|nr:VTT domain-containing protein [Candidatus Saccharibacteria bacterium]